MNKAKRVLFFVGFAVLALQMSAGFFAGNFLDHELDKGSHACVFFCFIIAAGIGVMAWEGGRLLLAKFFFKGNLREECEPATYKEKLEQSCRRTNLCCLIFLWGLLIWMACLLMVAVCSGKPVDGWLLAGHFSRGVLVGGFFIFPWIWFNKWTFPEAGCPHCGSCVGFGCFKEDSENGISRMTCPVCGKESRVDYSVREPFRQVLFGAGYWLAGGVVRVSEYLKKKQGAGEVEKYLSTSTGSLAACKEVKAMGRVWRRMAFLILIFFIGGGIWIFYMIPRGVIIEYRTFFFGILAIVAYGMLVVLLGLSMWIYRWKLEGIKCPHCSSPACYADFSSSDERGVACFKCPRCGKVSVSDFIKTDRKKDFPYRGEALGKGRNL